MVITGVSYCACSVVILFLSEKNSLIPAFFTGTLYLSQVYYEKFLHCGARMNIETIHTSIKHRLFTDQLSSDRNSTLYWQQQIFSVLATLMVGSSIVLLFFGVLQFHTDSNHLMLILYVAAFVLIMFITYSHSMPFILRKYALVYLSLATGILLIITAGSKGASCSYITASFILAALLLSRREVFFHSAVSVTAFTLLTIALSAGLFASQPISDMQDAWAFFISSSMLIGAVLAIIVHMITDGLLKQAEEVQLQKNDMAAVFASHFEPLLTIDRRGIITRANPAAVQLFAEQEQQLLDRPLSEVFTITDPQTGEPRYQSIERFLHDTAHQGFSQTALLSTATDQQRIISFSIAAIEPMHAGEQPSGAVITCKDITLEARAHDREQQRQKMESMGRLASGIAHDFNNMLGGIIGYGELIADSAAHDKQNAHSDTYLQYAEAILDAAGNAAKLVSQMQLFYRTSDEGTAPCDVHAVITQAIDILKRSISKSIRISFEPGALQHQLAGNESQLVNVFLNLGINARDAVGDSGFIEILSFNSSLPAHICEQSLFDLTPGEYVTILVRDSGTGIDPAVLPHIFEPFFTTKESGKGTGMGLSQVFGIISSHHGSIEASSTPGEGTLFTIQLPVSHQSAEDAVSEAHERAVGSDTEDLQIREVFSADRISMLIIDDERSILTFEKILLTSWGFTVHTAANGYEGIAAMHKHPEVHYVLLDLNLPGMDGSMVLDELTRINPSVRVIITTGYLDREKTLSLTADPAVHKILSKPFTSADLQKALLTLHRSEKSLLTE
jgi:two-component system, cell cycle sensor histidine kinase and response regulator CckA